MITRQQISNATLAELDDIKMKLIVEKMKLDKFFTIFLDNNELTEENVSTPEWLTYREMLKEYTRVDALIKATEYRLG